MLRNIVQGEALFLTKIVSMVSLNVWEKSNWRNVSFKILLLETTIITFFRNVRTKTNVISLYFVFVGEHNLE